MARAETESGPGPIGQPSRHQRCRMELLPPYAWPGTTSHRLQPGPPSPGPDPQGPPSPGPAPQGPPPCAGQPPRSHPQALSRDRTDSTRENQQTPRQRGALPDLLPQRELLPRASPRPRAPGGGQDLQVEQEMRRVGRQLRAIGDHLNATILQRAEGAPQWQGWRGVCRGLLAFLSETLSALQRRT
ncbi:bcl-2-binding component 3 isoform X2 [Osmerus eperlanus]|uniref:bcl-2-binding component 3 isoform X2 n=1 Tax=Osmerus eperlanus TaxID=29151 RepID=UPI002E0DFF49